MVISNTEDSARAESASERGQPACLLCGSTKVTSRRALSWGQLKKAWAICGVRFSPGALDHPDDSEQVKVWTCENCGFEFSNPALAGNGQFYTELQAQAENYYPARPYEFERAIQFAKERGLTDVLDVGCGSGAFLTLAKAAGLKTHGMELNPAGARLAREAGHEVFDCLLSDLVKLPASPRFSFVTAWQVLEHVSDPVTFLKECAAVTKPGGFVGIAVPNENSLRRLCPYDPHGWPPHHVTRWRIADLERIGRRAGLKMIASGADPLTGALGEHFWMLHNRLAPALGFKPHGGGAAVPKLLWFLYRKLGLRHWRPLPGASIYAFYAANA